MDRVARSSLDVTRTSQLPDLRGSVSHGPRPSRSKGETLPLTSLSTVMATSSYPWSLHHSSICSRWRSMLVDSSEATDSLVAPRTLLEIMGLSVRHVGG